MSLELEIKFSDEPYRRRCGSCTLCCKLVPVRELKKRAGERCRHQRHTGCAIYERRPHACRWWSCRWLTGEDTAELRRPDRAGYVIDVMPDVFWVDGEERPCIQVWCDGARRDAWRVPEMLAYIERRAAEGLLTLVRYSGSGDATSVFAPCVMADRQWHEVTQPMNPALRPENAWMEER